MASKAGLRRISFLPAALVFLEMDFLGALLMRFVWGFSMVQLLRHAFSRARKADSRGHENNLDCKLKTKDLRNAKFADHKSPERGVY
jgi:hypothetical protein